MNAPVAVFNGGVWIAADTAWPGMFDGAWSHSDRRIHVRPVVDGRAVLTTPHAALSVLPPVPTLLRQHRAFVYLMGRMTNLVCRRN